MKDPNRTHTMFVMITEGKTYREVGKIYGVSASRVRQIVMDHARRIARRTPTLSWSWLTPQLRDEERKLWCRASRWWLDGVEDENQTNINSVGLPDK